VFENKMLRGIFVFNREEKQKDGKKFHNKELHSLHSVPNTDNSRLMGGRKVIDTVCCSRESPC
jgi:hypothetical protein